MDTRHSANKSANVTGVNGVLLGVFPQKTRGSPGRKRDVGSIPITRSIFIPCRRSSAGFRVRQDRVDSSKRVAFLPEWPWLGQ